MTVLLDVPRQRRDRSLHAATPESQPVVLAGRTIAPGEPTFVIAEIGNNHNGSLAAAKQLIDAAGEAGADCAKFQMRDLTSLYRNGGDAQGLGEDLGAQYTLDLLSKFSLTPEEMAEAFEYTRRRGLIPLCTPWDQASLRRLERLGMPGYKIASADLTNTELLRAAAATGKPLIVSTGMSTEGEIEQAIQLLRGLGAQFVLLHCNSAYPAPYKDVELGYLPRLRELGGPAVGYSGHERGWHVPVAAVALGANVIEKHLTLDRSWEGNDHQVSLLPDELRAMVSAIRDVEQALGSGRPRQVTQGELLNRVALAKSLVATRDLTPGELITADAVEVRSPGRGLQPNRRDELIGRRVSREIAAGDFFYSADLDSVSASAPRPYRFDRPWGLPVRYHDYAALAARAEGAGATPDFLEFHLSYKDLDLDPDQFFPAPLLSGLAVHSPELFAADHHLDLAAADEDYRQHSIRELQRVVDLTRHLTRHFPNATVPGVTPPVVIVSMGGFSRDGHVSRAERTRRYERIATSLEQLSFDGVTLAAQTLPPFPWCFGGQMFHNLFVEADDTAAFCRETGIGLCLDISHSQLAVNHYGQRLEDFVEQVGPFVRHLHLVDAAGVDEEGLQIGEGCVDFGSLAVQLRRLSPNAGFIPEIWQGHIADGSGFWTALDRLETWFA